MVCCILRKLKNNGTPSYPQICSCASERDTRKTSSADDKRILHGKWLPKSRKVYDLDENGERIKLPSGNWKCYKESTVDWNEQYHGEEWRHANLNPASIWKTKRQAPGRFYGPPAAFMPAWRERL
nr:MobA/MobL family protein [Synergistes jonesii]